MHTNELCAIYSATVLCNTFTFIPPTTECLVRKELTVLTGVHRTQASHSVTGGKRSKPLGGEDYDVHLYLTNQRTPCMKPKYCPLNKLEEKSIICLVVQSRVNHKAGCTELQILCISTVVLCICHI